MWVSGANGFIGRRLVQSLANEGHAVHGVGRGAFEDADRQRVGLGQWQNGEIDPANLDALAGRSGSPSTIFHLAGGSSVGLSIAQPFEDLSNTVSSTARLLEWLRGSAPDCQLIVASSAAVYGAEYRGPIPENAEPAPMSPYGQHKLMIEHCAEAMLGSLAFAARSCACSRFMDRICASNCCGISVPGCSGMERR
jgi:UDP-glucose 4-epimerase